MPGVDRCNSVAVAFALTGDVYSNSRAIKQLRLLRSLGADVSVFFFPQSNNTYRFPVDVKLIPLPRPSGSGPSFFRAVHQTFLKALQEVPARVFHASDLYSLAALRHAARKHRGALVYDARELYPYVASTAGRPWVRAYWKWTERRNIRFADAVFTVSDSIARKLQLSYRIPLPPVLHNVPPDQQPLPSNSIRKRANVDDTKVLILHQGNIQKSRGCLLLADAMRDVRGAVLVFMGAGPQRSLLAEMIDRQGFSDRVRLIDPVPPEELLSVTAGADLAVTLLEDTCMNHRFALPNKLFEYLMAGVPVVASNLDEISRVVKGFDVGRLVNPSDRDNLVSTLQYCVDHPEMRAHWRRNAPHVFSEYNWSVASRRFTAVYEKLLQ